MHIIFPQNISIPFFLNSISMHGNKKCMGAMPRWRHDMEMLSVLLVLCSENPPVTTLMSNYDDFVADTLHYNDVIMGPIASQITSLTIVYSIVYSDTDQGKHQSSALLAVVRGIHQGPVNSPHKWPVTRKMFPFDDVIMWTSCSKSPVACYSWDPMSHIVMLIVIYAVTDTVQMFVEWIVQILFVVGMPPKQSFLKHRRTEL